MLPSPTVEAFRARPAAPCDRLLVARGLRYLIASGFNSLSMVGLILLVVIALLTSLILLMPQGGKSKEAHMGDDYMNDGMLGRLDAWLIAIMATLKEVSTGATAAAVSS